ncbi:replicative DNA helicase [Candidatus Poribacteria bacterium]|nr:replicative DNA helicase [Candidatus Poribacteria bacterium]MDE0687294.1 replicative DNA helicase [Candidatus Poribacteria bacterium]MXV85588.1 replicative DNA helicase [Candidatus Poribacteria bacterium]MYA56532.1 replicative DNA helicase [Candidatus Poribacteria bacterium]
MQAQLVDSLSDKEAEQAVLGAMMTENSVIPPVITKLGQTADVFLTVDHQLIYSAILAVYDRVSKADPLLVADELKRGDQLNRAGGTEYLYELQAPIVETESTEFYADILYEKATRRRLIRATAQIREMAYDEGVGITEVLNQSQEAVFDLSQSDTQRGFVAIHSLLTESLNAVERLYHKKSRFLGVPTGFMDFDHLTSGLQPGNLIIIAARPSMGKTTLVLNIAQNVALEQKRPVAVFSLEMPSQDIAMRMLATESRIDFGRLRTGNFSEDQWRPLTDGASRLAKAPILINDNRGLTVQSLRAEGRRLKGEHSDLALIIVDYLQLLRGTGRYHAREQEISEISRALKILAWELNVPIIACSQLSREIERRPDKRPQLSDLRESGAIEQDADLVAFLHRDDYYEDENVGDRVEAYIMIKKQRNGPTGTVILYFTKNEMRFENPS